MIAAVLLLLVSCALAEGPVPARFDFEQSELSGAWTTTAPEGKLAITRDRANVREGRGALELTWEATEGRLAIVSVGPVSFEGRPRSLRLSVKLSEQAPVMYGVGEANGVSYQGYLYTPGGIWHDLEISLRDLMLSEGCIDPSGRLDVREIDTITIGDLSNISGESGEALGIKSGRQQMWIDNVELSEELAPSRSSRGRDGEIIIDDFKREPILCLPIGAPRLSLVEGPGDDDTSALRVDYQRGGHRWVGFVGAVGHLNLSGKSRICLRVRAEEEAPLQMVLEERNGAKYVARHRLDPSKGWYEVRLPFDRFTLDPQTPDDNGRLDLESLRVIIPVVDSRRAELGEGGQGAWELSRIWVE